MATKKRGVTPSYETALSLEPRATLSEETGAPFSRQRVNEVLTTDCYDSGPSHPWEFRFGTKRRALLDEDKAARRDWAQRLLSEGHTAVWYRDNVVWVDICAKVIPGSWNIACSRLSGTSTKNLMSTASRCNFQRDCTRWSSPMVIGSGPDCSSMTCQQKTRAHLPSRCLFYRLISP